MTASEAFDQVLTPCEQELMAGLASPSTIQQFLDELAYSTDEFYRCPLRVLRERTAHCFDGAVFAAAALRRIGYAPLILQMLHNGRDDVHLLALFSIDGHWGAVAKSNFVGLRFREPIYRNLRELVLSYFEQFYNLAREKTLRGYTASLNLAQYDHLNWMTFDEPMELIAQRTDRLRQVQVITAAMSERLALVDERSYQAGLSGATEAGLYKPRGTP